MRTRRRAMLASGLLAAVLLVLTFGLPALAGGPFLEDDVVVIYDLADATTAEQYGWVGADVGDLNGDMVGDFIVTANRYSRTIPVQGAAFVYSGIDGSLLNVVSGTRPFNFVGYSATGAGDVNDDGTPDYAIGGLNEVLVYSGLDHSRLLTLTGQGFFGFDVAGGADVNGDGHDDLFVGAAFYSVTIPNAGQVYLMSGQDGATLWSREGVAEANLGGGVGIVGDVSGDGVADVVGAAFGANGGVGEAYVYSGVDGTTLLTMAPTAPISPSATYGQFFASDAGDVNADGTPDVFIGEYAALNGDGRAYVYSGVDGSPLLVLEAEAPGDGFGPGRGVGDVNGDGHADLFVASYLASQGAPVGGKAYLISGQDGAVLHTATGTVPGTFLGVDALGVGDLSGDGLQDYLLTGFGQAYVIGFQPPTAVTLSEIGSGAPASRAPLAALLTLGLAGAALLVRRR